MPDGNLSGQYKRRVLDAWKRGDKTIEESDVLDSLPLIVHIPMVILAANM